MPFSLQWHHNGHDCISNRQPHDRLLNRLFRCRSKKTSKLRVTCLCAGNSPGTGEFPAQMASNAENFSILWRHHVIRIFNLAHAVLSQNSVEFSLNTSCSDIFHSQCTRRFQTSEVISAMCDPKYNTQNSSLHVFLRGKKHKEFWLYKWHQTRI